MRWFIVYYYMLFYHISSLMIIHYFFCRWVSPFLTASSRSDILRHNCSGYKKLVRSRSWKASLLVLPALFVLHGKRSLCHTGSFLPPKLGLIVFRVLYCFKTCCFMVIKILTVTFHILCFVAPCTCRILFSGSARDRLNGETSTQFLGRFVAREF